jgi:pimeloyl-ACP methyl ester carboxylesterase
MWQKSIVVCERQHLAVSATEWSRRGFPCLFVHGLGDSSGIWSHLAARLISRFHVVGLDLRGHGESGWDQDARYDTETFAADLAKVADAYAFERSIVIGHSLGADVAIRFTAENPSRVAALIIVDFGPELNRAGIDEVLRGLASTPRTFAAPDDYAKWLMERRPMADPDMVKKLVRFGLRQSAPDVWEQKADPALATHSEISRLVADGEHYVVPELWRRLGEIKCPALVVRGGASGILSPDVASRMVDRTLWRGKLDTLSGAGHSVMMDNPAGFAHSVIHFLAGIPA